MPLIVAGKGAPSKKVRNDLISGIDIAPTCLAAAGIKIPKHMEGKNFLANSYTQRKFIVAARGSRALLNGPLPLISALSPIPMNSRGFPLVFHQNVVRFAEPCGSSQELKRRWAATNCC